MATAANGSAPAATPDPLELTAERYLPGLAIGPGTSRPTSEVRTPGRVPSRESMRAFVRATPTTPTSTSKQPPTSIQAAHVDHADRRIGGQALLGPSVPIE